MIIRILKLLAEVKHKGDSIALLKSQNYYWQNTNDTLKIENDELKKALRKFYSIESKIFDMKAIIKEIKNSVSDYERYKEKIDLAIKSFNDLYNKSLEYKDNLQNQNIARLESNVTALEYEKAEETIKNKKLREEIEQLKIMNEEKDQKILELDGKYENANIMVEKIRHAYNNLFAQHAKCNENFSLLCDEVFQGFTNSLDKEILNTAYQVRAPIGFPNIGQTCYLNAVLQVLFYSPEFLKLTYLSQNNLLLSLSKIANTIQNADTLNSWYRSFFQELLSSFPQVILIQIKAYHEQDAKEILFMILSQMNEIDQKRLFATVTSKNFKCSEGHIFNNTDLSFFIVVPSDSNIEDTLQDLYKEKEFDELYCDNCKEVRKQTVFVSRIEFPLYLAFYMAKNNHNTRKTSFIINKTIETFGGTYSLYAVICHRQNYTSGHYLAYVSVQGVWYECDDSRVRKQEPDYKAAYLLFYQKN